MTVDEWLERFAREIAVERPSRDEIAGVLELAASAAHASERTAAPVACWMAGRTGRPLGELMEAAKRVEAP